LQQLPTPVEERTIIIAADTIVTLDGQILGKPEDDSEARQMLSALRGRTHKVHTGMAIFDAGSSYEILDTHSAQVKMRDYTDREMAAYIASGDPLDKAGAYAIQNHKFRPVKALDGCYLGVMGLSICHLLQLFDQLEIAFRANILALGAAHQGFGCQLYDNIAQKHGK
jgi:MAF protein